MKTAACPQCGAALNLLPGVLAVQCLHCGDRFVADPAHSPESLTTQAAARLPPVSEPRIDRAVDRIAAQDRRQDLKADLVDAQDRLRTLRGEIGDERIRLSTRTLGRAITRWILFGGLGVLACGWVPYHPGTTIEGPDVRNAYLEMLSRARSARTPDGAIPVTVDRHGTSVALKITNMEIVSPGSAEESRYVADPVGRQSHEQRQALNATAESGWVLERIDRGSAIASAGFKVGDVITAFGGTELPALRYQITENVDFPTGYPPIRTIGASIATFGALLAWLRRSRLRRLRSAEQLLTRRVDAAMIGRA